MKEVQWYCCQKFVHYIIGSSGAEEVILMAATHFPSDKVNIWYLDTCCGNHMADNKNWFVKLDEFVKRSICFADNNMVTSEGMCNILVKKKDGHEATITDVFYVPSTTSKFEGTFVNQQDFQGHDKYVWSSMVCINHNWR